MSKRLSVGDGDGQFYLFGDGNWSTTCGIRGPLYSNWRAAPAASKYSICRWWFMNRVGWVLQALARFHSFCTQCNLPPLMYRSTGIAGEMRASIYVFFGMQAYACMVTKGTSQTGRRPGPCRHVFSVVSELPRVSREIFCFPSCYRPTDKSSNSLTLGPPVRFLTRHPLSPRTSALPHPLPLSPHSPLPHWPRFSFFTLSSVHIFPRYISPLR
jgi:hypothetical protein